MVLELKVPHGTALSDLRPMLPVLLSYVLSFVHIAIYWNNHHHLLHAADRVNGSILWANMHLLFWLSLAPLTTAWMGENHFAAAPTAVYGVVLLTSAIAYWLLQRAILAEAGPESLLASALGRDFKGNISPVIYLAAVGLSFVQTWIAQALYVVVALIWLIPDPRIERAISAPPGKSEEF
jgi:uncharacterized membrane protein